MSWCTQGIRYWQRKDYEIIEKLKNDRALIVYKIRSCSAVDFRHVFETTVEEISVL